MRRALLLLASVCLLSGCGERVIVVPEQEESPAPAPLLPETDGTDTGGATTGGAETESTPNDGSAATGPASKVDFAEAERTTPAEDENAPE